MSFGSFASVGFALMKHRRDPNLARINKTIPKMFRNNRMTENKKRSTLKELLREFMHP